MIKIDVIKEIQEKLANGYKGELLYNYRSGNYEVTLWKADEQDLRSYKIARGLFDPNYLKDLVYGTHYTRQV